MSNIKTEINTNIHANMTTPITGGVLNGVLIDMVDDAHSNEVVIGVEKNRGSVTSQTNVRCAESNGLLFSANSLVYTPTTTSQWQGIALTIPKPYSGETLVISSNRTWTYRNYTYKVDFYNAEGTVSSTKTFTSNTAKVVIPSGQSKVVVYLVASWGASVATTETFEFTDVKIYYEPLDDRVSSLETTIGGNKCELTTAVTGGGTILGHLADISGANMLEYCGRLCKVDSVKYVADSTNAYQGVRVNISSPIVGKTISVKGTRSNGNDYAIKLTFYKSDNTSTNVLSYDNEAEGVVPSNCTKIEVNYCLSWGTALSVGATATFTNIEIAYKADASDNGKDKLGFNALMKMGNVANGLQMHKEILVTKTYDSERGARFMLNQSLAVYGDYIFEVEEYDQCYVFNRNTLAELGIMWLPLNSHNSNAQFTNVRASSSDEFPLLLISGAMDNENGHTFLRITRSGTTFTCTKWKEVTLDRGAVSFFDTDRNKMTFAFNYLNTYTDTSNANPVKIVEFDAPDLTSQASVSLSVADGNEIASLPMFVIQGNGYANGYYFMGCQLKNGAWARDYKATFVQSIIMVNASSGAVEAIYNTESAEPQGVTCIDGEIYFTARDTTARGSNIVFWLYRLGNRNIISIDATNGVLSYGGKRFRLNEIQ